MHSTLHQQRLPFFSTLGPRMGPRRQPPPHSTHHSASSLVSLAVLCHARVAGSHTAPCKCTWLATLHSCQGNTLLGVCCTQCLELHCCARGISVQVCVSHSATRWGYPPNPAVLACRLRMRASMDLNAATALLCAASIIAYFRLSCRCNSITCDGALLVCAAMQMLPC